MSPEQAAARAKQLYSLFDALGDPTRFKLVQKMNTDCNSCVSELAEELNITTAGASQQLKILEQAGVLLRVRKGQRICYEINHDDPDVAQVMKMLNGKIERSKK